MTAQSIDIPTSPATADLGDALIVERASDTTALVTINRPDQRNALTLAMWVRLAEIFEALAERSELRAIVLTGAGGAFCAGANIKEFDTVRATNDDALHYAAMVDRATVAITRCPKATYAAVSGPCFGGGVGVAVACDFRIADTSAYFAITASRLSIVYGIEETRALYHTVGLVAAKEMLFSGRRYHAEDALRIGLVSEISEGEALPAAIAAADELAGCAPLSIAGTKIVLEALTEGETAEREERMSVAVERAVTSEDYREGRAAFAEKRRPHFTGR
ncbi:enoyl-CoA hydratase-related protein [Acuticoccus sp. M5D2P5]|uniref:enoyl-CoA hydratase-related protein n=1 Tax=Acuticoccus kalidii TaxID=2910977 RepID=UPI001F413BBA|nr:enoyl-CoA hydratase-related protein [Acuticoccus kalidii]MCF3934489.1 enoyl-CoA hydratase-related protein [Acuticoccus kalidii]